MKIGEGRFHKASGTLYVPKGVVTALALKDHDIVEYHVTDQTIFIQKQKGG